jgi:hypothetical protein
MGKGGPPLYSPTRKLCLAVASARGGTRDNLSRLSPRPHLVGLGFHDWVAIGSLMPFHEFGRSHGFNAILLCQGGFHQVGGGEKFSIQARRGIPTPMVKGLYCRSFRVDVKRRVTFSIATPNNFMLSLTFYVQASGPSFEFLDRTASWR